MAEVGILRLKVDASGAVTGFAQFDAAAKRSGVAAKSTGDNLRGLGLAMKTLALGAGVRELIQAATAMDRLNSRMLQAMGSTKAAAAEMGFVRSEAARLGLDLQKTAHSYTGFATAAGRAGISAGDIRRVFIGVSEAATVMGLSGDEAAGALRALEQMASKGTVSAEELRGQLGERLPGAFSLAAKSMGMTEQALGKAMQKGEVMASELLPKLAAEMHKTFGPQATAAADNMQANLNRISSGWFELSANVGKSGGVMNDVARGIATGLQFLVKNWGFLEASVYSTLAGITNATVKWGSTMLGVYERVANAAASMVPDFVSTAPDNMAAKIANLRKELEGYGADLSEVFGDKADAAIRAQLELNKAAEQGGAVLGGTLAGGLGKAGEMSKKLADHLAEVNFQLRADTMKSTSEMFASMNAKSPAMDQMLVTLKRVDELKAQALTKDQIQAANIAEIVRLYEAGNLTLAERNELLRQNGDHFEVQVAQATEWGEAIKNANENALRGIQSAFAGFFKTLLTDGKLTWKELGKGLIDVFASVVSELLARWIVLELKKTAETIRQAAVRAAAERAGSVAGGGSSAGAGSALSGAGSAAGGAGGGGGGVAGTGVSGTALAGAAVIAFALFVVYKAFIEKSERWASVNLRTGEATGNSGRVKDQIRARLGAIYKAIEEVTKEFDLAMTKLGDVTITKRGGQYSVSGLGGIMTQVFKTGEEAMEYAAVMAIRFGEFAEGVSEFMQAIVRGSQAVTMDALRADLALGREVERLGQSGTEAAIRSGVAHFDELRAAMVRLIKDSALLAQALDKINKAEIELFASERDRITGRQKNAKEEFEDRKRQAVLWNAERALRIANINLMILETKAKIQMMLVSMALLAQWNGRTGGGGPGYGEGGTGRGPGGPGTGDGGVPNPYQPYKGGTGEGPYKPPRPGEGTGNAQLDGLYAFLDSLMAILGSLPGAIDPNEVRPGRGNRQARRDAQQGLRDEAAMFGKSDIAIQLAETALWLTEFAKRVKEAGFNAAESAAMMASAEAEAARRREEIKQDVLGRAKDFIGPGAGGSLGKALADVGKQSADLIADLRELRAAGQLTGTEFQSLAASITRAAAAARAGLFEDAKNDLFLQLYDALGMEKEAAEFRFRMAVAEMRIKIEELRIAGRIYGLNVDFLGELQLLVNEFERRGPVYPGSPAVAPGTHGSRNGEIMQSGGHNWRWVTSDPVYNMGYWDDLGPVAPESGPRVDPDWLARQNAPSGYEALAKDRKSLLGRLAGYEELRFDPITRGLRALNQEFAEMRAEAVRLQVPLAKVNEAYTLALNDWWKNTLQGVREFRDSMALAPTSSLTGAQQFTASRDSFRESLSALRGGDLSQISRITQLGSQYMTQGQQATGGEAYRFIEREVRDAMTSILGLAPPTALPTGAATAPMYMEAPTVVTAINTASNAQMIAIQNAAVVQVATLREMQTVLSDIESHTADTAYNTAETVVSLRSVA